MKKYLVTYTIAGVKMILSVTGMNMKTALAKATKEIPLTATKVEIKEE